VHIVKRRAAYDIGTGPICSPVFRGVVQAELHAIVGYLRLSAKVLVYLTRRKVLLGLSPSHLVRERSLNESCSCQSQMHNSTADLGHDKITQVYVIDN